MNTIEKGLLILGLSEVESSIYLSVCVFGKQSTTELSKSTGISRTTIDAAVRKLYLRKLLSRHPFGKRFVWGIPPNFSEFREEIVNVLNEIERVSSRH
jgi:predicted DNA-binding transcriptional regulator